MAALAGAGALGDRRDDGEGDGRARAQVDWVIADVGAAVGVAGDRADAGGAAENRGDGGIVALGSTGPESGCRDGDERRVVLPEHVGPERERLHDAGAHVVDNGVAALHEVVDDVERFGALEVDGDALLVEIERVEEWGPLRVAAGDHDRALEADQVDSPGRFQADHLGAEAAEQIRRRGPGGDP